MTAVQSPMRRFWPCIAPEERNSAWSARNVWAGLPIPREPAEIQGGTGADVLAGRARVISRDGKDVTAAYLAGAQKGLQMAKAKGADTVLLKSKSPSCGAGRIHDGSFSGRLVPGNGVFAELLMQNGIRVLEME